jgi:hypothetical protein
MDRVEINHKQVDYDHRMWKELAQGFVTRLALF